MIILIEVFYPTEHIVSSKLKCSNREVLVRTGLTAYQISKLLLMQCRYLQTELHCLWMNHNNLGALNKIKQAGNGKQKRKNHPLCSASCGRWLVLICCERKVLLAGWWLVLIWCERMVASRTEWYIWSWCVYCATDMIYSNSWIMN